MGFKAWLKDDGWWVILIMVILIAIWGITWKSTERM